MQNFAKVVVVLMVITGTLNTISASLQLARQAENINGDVVYFDHYIVQTLFMMLGECLCMVAYLILKYVVHKNDHKKVDGDALPMNPLVLWPAAFLDIVATSLGYMGLGFMKNAGFFQMLRCSPIIFCGILSIFFLGQKLKAHNWIGIATICIGLVIKAIPDALAPFADHDDVPNILPVDPNGWNYCNEMLTPNATTTTIMTTMSMTTMSTMTTTMGLNTTTVLPEEAADDNSIDMLIGICLVLVGEFFHGVQFVYESKYMTKYNLPPLKVVGLEGVNGALTLLVLLWPVYFIDMGEKFGLGPNHRFEDMIDGLKMIFDGGPENGGWLLAWTIGNMFSIAIFNFAGISVMKELSATTRAVLDQIRVVLIWMVFLLPLGPYLCRLQDHFVFVAPIGLVILICGVFIYNDIVIMPAVRKYVLKQKVPEPITEKDLEMTEKEKEAVE